MAGMLEPDKGYVLAVTLEDLTIIFLFCSPRLSSFQTIVERLHLNGGSFAV